MFYANREDEARMRHRVKDSACKDCLFFQPGVDDEALPDEGECHRHAPYQEPGRRWTTVWGDDWCGEFLWQEVPE